MISSCRNRVAAVIALALAVAAGITLIISGLPAHSSAAPVPTRTFGASTSQSAGAASEATAVALPRVGDTISGPSCTLTVRPNALLIPSLCVDARLQPSSVQTNGSLTIPTDVHTVGYWDDGAPLAGSSATAGTTLLAGHVDYTGQGHGALYPLSTITPGAAIYTVDDRGMIAPWQTTTLRSVTKQALPRDLFNGTDGPRRLALVTCGGPLIRLPDGTYSYRDNIIVTANSALVG